MQRSIQFELIKWVKSRAVWGLVVLFIVGVGAFSYRELDAHEQGVNNFQIAMRVELEEVAGLQASLSEKQTILGQKRELSANEQAQLATIDELNDVLEPVTTTGEQMLTAYEVGDFMAYYAHRKQLLLEYALVEPVLESTWIWLLDSGSQATPRPDVMSHPEPGAAIVQVENSKEYELLTALEEIGEPLVLRTGSFAPAQLLLAFFNFLLSPYVLMLLVIILNIIFLEETGGATGRLMATESDKRRTWLRAGALLGGVSMILAVLLSGAAVYFGTSRLAAPLFGHAPTVQAPLQYSGELFNDLSLREAVLISLGGVLLIGLTLHVLFRWLLGLVKQPLFTVLGFIGVTTGWHMLYQFLEQYIASHVPELLPKFLTYNPWSWVTWLDVYFRVGRLPFGLYSLFFILLILLFQALLDRYMTRHPIR